LASSASTVPSGVLASGFTSTRVASSCWKTSHSWTAMAMTWSRTSAGKFAASTISVAFAVSTPLVASMGMRARASGLVAATSSISMPPSTEAIARKVRLERSRR
jgi:hypothetical protein